MLVSPVVAAAAAAVELEVRVSEAGFRCACVREVWEYVAEPFRNYVGGREPAFPEVF